MQHTCTIRPGHALLQAAVAVAFVTLVSCGGGRNFHKVYPVKGKILVNGQPVEECQIVLNRTFEDKNPVTPQALTNANGEFQITTYFANDGAPEGEYIATIEWRERSGVTKMDFEGPDRLGGVYAKVEKTKALPGFVIKVEKSPLELPPFNLTQSAEVKRKLEEAKKRKTGFGGPLGSSDR
jgi:hypothetical protein